MSDLVGNPEDRFSHNEAHIKGAVLLISLQKKKPLCIVVKLLALKTRGREFDLKRHKTEVPSPYDLGCCRDKKP